MINSLKFAFLTTFTIFSENVSEKVKENKDAWEPVGEPFSENGHTSWETKLSGFIFTDFCFL